MIQMELFNYASLHFFYFEWFLVSNLFLRKFFLRNGNVKSFQIFLGAPHD